EGQLECVASDEGRVHDALACDLEHRFALVETDDLAAKVPRQEARAAGDVERARRRERGDDLLEARDVLVPARSVAIGVEAGPEIDVVVLGRAAVVVRLHRLVEYARAAARVRPELLRGARPWDDRGARRGAVGARHP